MASAVGCAAQCISSGIIEEAYKLSVSHLEYFDTVEIVGTVGLNVLRGNVGHRQRKRLRTDPQFDVARGPCPGRRHACKSDPAGIGTGIQ